MSNVSVILCVPHLIKNNCYSIINTVTEPMQCNTSTLMLVEITNKIGAYMRVEEEYESQRLSVKMVDNNIYNVEFVDSIQHNQMIGDTPNYCIPLSINAITVQGMSYSDPYFISFNLKYDKMASGSPKYMNKSDYAFNSSVCIKNEPSEKTQLLNDKSAHNIMNKSNETRMNTDDKSERIDHDNNWDDIIVDALPTKTFMNGDLTFDALLRLVKSEESKRKSLQVDDWGTPLRMGLCGGGESSLNTTSGWGSPPSANNNAGNWGGNSSGQSSNSTNNTQQWNNTAQRPPGSQADMNSNKGNGNPMPPANAAGGGQSWQSSPPNLPNAPPNNNAATAANNVDAGPNPGNGGASPTSGAANGPNGGNPANGTANTTSSAKIEQLNSMREALFSQDGWGGQHVNQDTNWDVPGSPEPGSKVEPTAAGGPPPWKPNISSGLCLGTDL